MKVVMLVIFAGLFLATGCAPVGVGNPTPPYPDDEPYMKLSVPPGHLPPPTTKTTWSRNASGERYCAEWSWRPRKRSRPG